MNSSWQKIRETTAHIIEAAHDCLPGKLTQRQEATEQLINWLHELFVQLANDFNCSVEHEPLMVSTRRLNYNNKAQNKHSYARLIVATSFWALSIRGKGGVVEFFNVPTTELPTMTEHELSSRVKLKLKLESLKLNLWTIDGVPFSKHELDTLMRSLFRDLVKRSHGDFELAPEALRLVSDGQSLAGSVRNLVQEKHALVRKIVNQQEAIQNQVAREIHDAVLGNVMLLKRSLASNRRMSDAEMIVILDEITNCLRDVCQDLSPRDLKDCGLQSMLEELCDNLSTRTNCHCVFNCPDIIPKFPHETSLHIYRIVQECFNNIAKHAFATKVELITLLQDGLFTVIIRDNGKGFDLSEASERVTRGDGVGTSIIKERAELINCFYPTRIWIDSQSTVGTTITLQIMFVLPE